MKEIKIYCDGGSFNNGYKDPNLDMYGSYCTLIVNKNNEIHKIFTGIKKDFTNNQSELFAAMFGLHYIKKYMTLKHPKEKIKVFLCSDSQYVIKGCSEWLYGWKKRGWKNSSGKTLPNLDMWKNMDKLLSSDILEISYKHVKGHKGKSIKLDEDPDIYFNELCDTHLTEELEPIRKKFNFK